MPPESSPHPEPVSVLTWLDRQWERLCPGDHSSKLKLWMVALATMVVGYGILNGFHSSDLANNRGIQELAHWSSGILLLAGYGLGYAVVRSAPFFWKNPQWKIWLRVTGIALGAFVFLNGMAVPYNSTDLFGYINRGWQQLAYGTNPYFIPVSQIEQWEQDPMFWNHWVNNPNPYGFLFTLLTLGVTMVGGEHFWVQVGLWKGINILLTGGIAWMLVQWGKRYQPKTWPVTLYLFLASPLWWIHFIGNGHNDLWMPAFGLAGLLMFGAGKRILLMPAAMAAALIKYAPLVSFPLLMIWQWRMGSQGSPLNQGKMASWCAGLALSISLLALTALPYVLNSDAGILSLDKLTGNATVMSHSLVAVLFDGGHEVLKLIFGNGTEAFEVWDGRWRSTLKVTAFGAFGLGWLWLALWVWRNTPLKTGAYSIFQGGMMASSRAATKLSDLEEDATGSGWQFMRTPLMLWVLPQAILILLVSSKFNPWYVGVVFPLALAFLPGHGIRQWIVATTVVLMFSPTFIGQAHIINALILLGLPLAAVVHHQWTCARRLYAPAVTPVSPVVMEEKPVQHDHPSSSRTVARAAVISAPLPKNRWIASFSGIAEPLG